MNQEPLSDPAFYISSIQNPKVKGAYALRERRQREKTGRFLIEGFRELSRALIGGFSCETLFVCPEFFLGSNEFSLIEQYRHLGTTVYRLNQAVFEKISYRDRPDGLIGIAIQRHLTLEDLKLPPHPLLVIAEAIEKPGNLGTILRSADGVGADAVVVCDRCTDIYNPNTVRASVGTLFTRPVLEAEGKKTFEFLKKAGIRIIATLPEAKTIYTDADLTKGIAIVLGTEQLGLTPLWENGADLGVSIPMRGVADSLNVAMAGTLLLYEALRQRS